MQKGPQQRIRWSGDATLSQAVACLERGVEFQLDLPPSVHHALFARLVPDAPLGQPELIDVHGGSELVDSISTVAGLEALRDLVTPLADAHTHVTVVSPHPRIVVTYSHRQ